MLLVVDRAFPARPDEIAARPDRQHRSVDRPAVGRIGDLALERPAPRKRICVRVLQHVHAMVLVAAVVGGEIDVPFAVEVVQLRRPDVGAVHRARRRRPDDRAVAGVDAGDRLGAPQRDVVAGRLGVVVIAVRMLVHPRIGSVLLDDVEEVRDRSGLRLAAAHRERQSQGQAEGEQKQGPSFEHDVFLLCLSAASAAAPPFYGDCGCAPMTFLLELWSFG